MATFPTTIALPVSHFSRVDLENWIEAAVSYLDFLDGDPDLEETCEDEGAQCDDEGVPHYDF